MTCEDCLHYEVCHARFEFIISLEKSLDTELLNVEKICQSFKDKSRYVEQKHGKWEEIRNAYGEIEGWIHAKCGRETNEKMKYCPNCGAKMDGKEDT